MEFSNLIRSRRMTRNYLDRPVDPGVIERIVAVARKNPSAGFTQGQYLVIVTEEATRKRIAKLADEDEYVATGFPPWISTAPVHIVVCTSERDYHMRYQESDKLQPDGTEIDWPVPYWWVDAGACLMLLLLAVADEGLAAGFFGVHRLIGLNELLEIPREVTPIGVVTVGHAAPEQPKGSSRRGWRPLQDIVRREKW